MSFLCPRCAHVSYRPEDERTGYCGACHEFTALKAGDVIRVRSSGSADDWCLCSVVLTSSNGESLALRVVDGAVRAPGGGFVTGMLAVSFDPLRGAVEVFSNAELEMELHAPRPS